MSRYVIHQSNLRRGAVLVVVASVCACGGGLQSAVVARTSAQRACEANPGSDRLACVEKLAVLRDDEPTSGGCWGNKDGSRWLPQDAPTCLEQHAGGILSTCGAMPFESALLGLQRLESGTAPYRREELRTAVSFFRRRPEELAADCNKVLAALDSANDCLRASAVIPSKICFVEVERARLSITERIKTLPAFTAEVKRLADAADARVSNAEAGEREAERVRRAKKLIDDASAQCGGTWTERSPLCDDAALRQDERQACVDGCRTSGREAVERAFAAGLDQCVASFGDGSKDHCAIERPNEAFLPVADFEKRRAACTQECKKKGPAARAEAQRAEAEARRGRQGEVKKTECTNRCVMDAPARCTQIAPLERQLCEKSFFQKCCAACGSSINTVNFSMCK